MMNFKKIIHKCYSVLKLSGKILRNLFVSGRTEFSKNKKFRLAVIGIVAVIAVLIVWNIPRWYKMFKFRTHNYGNQKKLSGVSEEKAGEGIKGKCDEIRNEAEQRYLSGEIAEAIKNSREEKIILVGGEDKSPRGNSASESNVIIDTSGKDVSLSCFDFFERVIVKGDGTLDLGYSGFWDISGNALSVSGGGKGKIHHNLIEKSGKSGVFINSGKWEIYGNIIKGNLSYGVYGGYSADLALRENAIFDNGGYEVRIMKEREIYK